MSNLKYKSKEQKEIGTNGLIVEVEKIYYKETKETI